MGKQDILEEELRIGSAILEWEIGDIWGHVGARNEEKDEIIIKGLRLPGGDERDLDDWIVRFDYDGKKTSGVDQIPGEAAIYTEILKARPDVNAVVHLHPPMCIALSLADKTVYNVHQQSRQFGAGVPVFPHPIFIIDKSEGQALAKTLGDASAVIIKGHGVVTVGKDVDDAVTNALYLERTAKIQAFAHLLGFKEPKGEFLAEMNASSDKLQALIRNRGERRDGRRYSIEWSYYARQVRKGLRWTRGFM